MLHVTWSKPSAAGNVDLHVTCSSTQQLKIASEFKFIDNIILNSIQLEAVVFATLSIKLNSGLDIHSNSLMEEKFPNAILFVGKLSQGALVPFGPVHEYIVGVK